MKVILDYGHGEGNTNCSPFEPKLYEWEYVRKIGAKIKSMLDKEGIPYYETTIDDKDISLKQRCSIANAIYANDRQTYLLSIHANAGGGQGFEVWTSIGQTLSDKIATLFYEDMIQAIPEWNYRLCMTDGDVDKESNFYILKNTSCPAVLVEDGFFDNKYDYECMMQDEYIERIAKAHFETIKLLYADEA